jgi:hypothetical protein
MRISYFIICCVSLVLAGSAATYLWCTRNIPALQQNAPSPDGNTRQYTDIPAGFNVEIPANFALYDIERSYEQSSFAFGGVAMFDTAGYDGQWFINVFNVDDTEYIPWGKYHMATEHTDDSIIVNGIPALRRRSTSTQNPDWEAIEVAVRRGDRLYVIHNGGRNTAEFEQFYNSFTLENDTHN